MTYGIGLVGLGSIARRMLDAISSHERFTAIAAWDPSPAACAAARGRVDVAPHAEAVVGDPRVDVVYVACPPAHHARHALAAAAAGKALLCEKPLGVDLAESRALVASIEASGVASAVNLLFGGARNAAVLAAALAGGTVGEVVRVEIRLHLPRWATRRVAEAPWLGERVQGGFVREVGTHHVYLCRRLLGPLRLRYAEVRYPADGIGAERAAAAVLDAGGVPVTLAGAIEGAGPERNELTVWGERASYRVRDLHLLDVADGDRWIPAFEPAEHPERDTHRRQLDALARVLAGEAGALADPRAALEVQETVEAILARAMREPTAAGAERR